MASSSTIKQRFMDILFEPDEEEKINEMKQERRIDKSQITETSTIKATDILYKKGGNDDQKTVFINLTETKTNANTTQNEEKPLVEEEPYVTSPNLSPIFGNIDNTKKKRKSSTANVDYASTEKPSSNYLGMVLSPIYGYDTIKANDARAKFNNAPKAEYEDSDITEDLTDIFETEEFKQYADEEPSEDELDKTDDISLFDDLYIDEEK